MALFPFLGKRAPAREPNDAPRQPEVFYLQSGIGVAIVRWNDYIAAEHALRHPIVARALDKIAGSVQQVSWKVVEDPEALPEDRAGKKGFVRDLQCVINDPGSDMTPAMMRYWMTLNYACYGRVPLRVGFGAMRPELPNGIYPLEARYVRAHLSQRGIASRYDYGDGENKQTFIARDRWDKGKPGGFVDQIWKPALKGYQHKDEKNSPLQSVGLPSQVIKSLLMRAIQTAEGHPNVRYMVTCSKTLTPDQKTALREHINEEHGPDGPSAGNVPILQNAGDIQIHELNNDLSDIHSKMPSDDMARLIFGAFGIPIALAGMGAADGAKFAGNYIESRQAFWQDTVIPYYVNPLFQGMTRMLCPPGVLIAPDLDSIPALVQGRIANMKEASAITFLTTDEKRALYGLNPAPAGFVEGNAPAQTQTPPNGGQDA